MTASHQPPRVLVVDDDQPIRDLVRGYLAREGMEVTQAVDGRSALAAMHEQSPDVVVLDLMLPGPDGIEVCRQLRTFSDAYVVMLTARDDEVDRLVGLSIGADDYMVKPFSPRELVARIKALLRRPRDRGLSPMTGGLEVDPARRRASVGGREVRLTTIEFDLLAALVRDPGIVLTRAQLLDRVWGTDFVGDDHVLDVHIGNLRRKLGDDPAQPRFVETVRGVGFRIVAP
jgi:two-component system, OmpR family, alkaline phosphatase synthesis response regulator PhoP